MNKWERMRRGIQRLKDSQQGTKRWAKLRESLLKRVERVVSRTKDFSDASTLKAVARRVEERINAEGHMQRMMKARFQAEAEHGPGSRKWKALSPRTLISRMRAGFGRGPILQNTRALAGAAQAAVAGTFKLKGVKWSISRVAVPYGKYHQSGGGRLPARPFINNPTPTELQPVMKRVKDIIRIELRREIRKAATA